MLNFFKRFLSGEAKMKGVMVHFARDKRNPWALYKKGITIGFGLTFTANTATGCYGMSEISAYKEPETFFLIIFLKSVEHGILFPIIPFKIIGNPRHYFILGEGVKENFK